MGCCAHCQTPLKLLLNSGGSGCDGDGGVSMAKPRGCGDDGDVGDGGATRGGSEGGAGGGGRWGDRDDVVKVAAVVAGVSGWRMTASVNEGGGVAGKMANSGNGAVIKREGGV
ncbi:hypothetical protein Tco_0134838 [Tanacetum coccineum]